MTERPLFAPLAAHRPQTKKRQSPSSAQASPSSFCARSIIHHEAQTDSTAATLPIKRPCFFHLSSFIDVDKNNCISLITMFHRLLLIVAVTLAAAFSVEVCSQSFVEEDLQFYLAKGIVFGERAVSVLAFFLPEFLT
jgi:hypothetical protein